MGSKRSRKVELTEEAAEKLRAWAEAKTTGFGPRFDGAFEVARGVAETLDAYDVVEAAVTTIRDGLPGEDARAVRAKLAATVTMAIAAIPRGEEFALLDWEVSARRQRWNDSRGVDREFVGVYVEAWATDLDRERSSDDAQVELYEVTEDVEALHELVRGRVTELFARVAVEARRLRRGGT